MLIMLVVQRYDRLRAHKRHEHRCDTDSFLLHIVELFANAGRVQLVRYQVSLFSQFAKRCLPCHLTRLKSTCNLAPGTAKGSTGTPKQQRFVLALRNTQDDHRYSG